MQNADLDRVVGGVNGQAAKLSQSVNSVNTMPREIGVRFMSMLP